MKKYLFIFLVSSILQIGFFTSPLRAQSRFSAGFTLGEPTGFSWNYRINHTHAVDGAFGFAPADEYRIHADYLWTSYPVNDQNFNLYYGIGAVIGFGRTTGFIFENRNGFFYRDREPGFGLRGPLGVSYLIPRSPVNLFMEVAPTVIFTDTGGFGLDGGLGIRFIF